MSQQKEKVAVHCHGRHLDAVDWKSHMWLSEDGQLGQVPVALLVAVKKGASLLSFGTGASEKDGLKEAAWTRRFAIDAMAQLKNHELFRDADFARMQELLNDAFLDLESQNTVQELNRVYEEYARRGITEVYAVTNPSHGPRCRRDLDVHIKDRALRMSSYIVTSEVPFAGSATADTVILEAPHRGDDTSPPFYKLVPKLFRIPAKKKDECYEQFKNLLDSFLN